MSDIRPTLQPAPSPTGAPVLPTWLAPYVAAVVIVSGAALTELPSDSVWAKVCRVLVMVGIAYGVVSPGWRRGGAAVLLLCLGLGLSGCVGLHQHPKPVGQPGPVACYGAKQAKEAWRTVIVPYLDGLFDAQEAYSCGPVAPAEPPPALMPLLQAR